MTDIVKRLQDWNNYSDVDLYALLDEAADEIVQLRTDLAVAVKVGGEMTVEVQRLRGHLGVLRPALLDDEKASR